MSEQENDTAASAGPTEISRDDALRRLLSDEALSDVTLRGTDDAEVMANRCLLAARSDVFRALLCGNFTEGSEATVSIGYPGYVLRAVVRYIYTDGFEPFSHTDEAFHPPPPDVPADVEIMEAANYYHLPGLRELAKECAVNSMKNDPSYAFTALSAAAELNIPDIEQAAMTCVRTKLPEIMEKPWSNIECLTSSLLERILRDEEMQADEKTLFKLLKIWAENGDDIEDQSRKEVASDMTAHIRLEQIDPETLSGTVASSGLVSDARLMEAYKAQALLASSLNKKLFNRKRKRGVPHWKPRSGVDIKGFRVKGQFEYGHLCFFDVPEMTIGVHKWRLKVSLLSREYSSFFGVSCPGSARDAAWRDSSWMVTEVGYCNDGGNEHEVDISFSDQSILAFTLNIQEEDGATLSVSVDGEDEKVIFRNFAEGRALAPSVHVAKGAVVEILDMESE